MLHAAVDNLRILSAPSLAKGIASVALSCPLLRAVFCQPPPIDQGPTSRYVRAKNTSLATSQVAHLLGFIPYQASAWKLTPINHSADKLAPRCPSFRVSLRQPLSRLVCYIPLDLKNGRAGTDCKSGTHALDTIALVGNERLFWCFKLLCTPQPR